MKLVRNILDFEKTIYTMFRFRLQIVSVDYAQEKSNTVPKLTKDSTTNSNLILSIIEDCFFPLSFYLLHDCLLLLGFFCQNVSHTALQ